MRWILNAFYLSLLPWAAPYWLWKLPQARRYRAGVLERLGLAPRSSGGAGRLWIHCASVGEASIPRQLVARFRGEHPQWEVAFSTCTDTGASRLRGLYPDCPVFYLPLDLSFCVERALSRVQPSLVVLLELEMWPNFLLGCLGRGIPVAIVSGRINEPSARFLHALTRLCPGLWKAVSVCCARSAADAARFVQAGLSAHRAFAYGSLKYETLVLEVDRGEQDSLRQRLGLAQGARVLVAGSIHPGEEEIVCRVYGKLVGRHGDLRLVLVPRHVEAAALMARRVEAAGLSVVRKADLDSGRRAPSGTEVILVDTIGELIACYSIATCAFVGRSLVRPGGGQNMMEPAALGKPVLVGPFTGNFEPEMDLLLARGAVVVVQDESSLLSELDRLLTDGEAARALGQHARLAVTESRGATERTFGRIEALLAERGLL